MEPQNLENQSEQPCECEQKIQEKKQISRNENKEGGEAVEEGGRVAVSEKDTEQMTVEQKREQRSYKGISCMSISLWVYDTKIQLLKCKYHEWDKSLEDRNLLRDIRSDVLVVFKGSKQHIYPFFEVYKRTIHQNILQGQTQIQVIPSQIPAFSHLMIINKEKIHAEFKSKDPEIGEIDCEKAMIMRILKFSNFLKFTSIAIPYISLNQSGIISKVMHKTAFALRESYFHAQQSFTLKKITFFTNSIHQFKSLYHEFQKSVLDFDQMH